MQSGITESRDPLMQTKLDLPAVLGPMVERSKLLDRLHSSTTRIVVLEAPAGWGKTSLLAAWMNSDSEERQFAFIRLGAADNDTRTFWSYVVAAVRRLDESLLPDIDEGLQLAGIDPTRSVIPAFVNGLREWGQQVVLVLDDYHLIEASDVHRSVDFLIEHAPSNLTLVLSTRSDPPLALQRYRVGGELTEVRSGDLQINAVGTQEMFAARFGLDIDLASADALCTKTEGWPAGIQLAALSCASDPDPSAFIASFSGTDRNVVDYLTSEVLSRLPESTRDFLLQTSILDEISVDLCDWLLDRTDSANILEGLERDSMFLVPLDSKRQWFRYHHLFGDWLRHTLRRSSLDTIPELHRRAGIWFKSHDMSDQAIDHAVAAGDIESAAEQINAYLLTLPYIYSAPVQGWFKSIPDDVASQQPAIVVAFIFQAMTSGDTAATQRWVDTLEEAAQNEDDIEQRRSLISYGRLYRGVMEMFAGDPSVAEAEFRSIVDAYPVGSHVLGTVAGSLLGVAMFVTTGAKESVNLLREGSIHRRRLSVTDGGTTSILAAAYAELGLWADAESTAAEALLANPQVEGAVFPSRMGAHYAMAQVLDHQGRTDEAIERLQVGLDEARLWPMAADTAWGCLLMSRIVKQPAEKRHFIDEAVRLGSRGRFVEQVAAAEKRLTSAPNRRDSSGSRPETLTPRELDVLRLLRGDLSLREIAGELFVSYNTVKGYTKTIYQKLAVSSRTEAVSAAVDLGVI